MEISRYFKKAYYNKVFNNNLISKLWLGIEITEFKK